ncbi:NADH dehydrogenase (ubiquinone) 1 alpha subcomplex 13 [Blastocystis sp. ATCC 50177/Nand II]|uniref:NADH dehydrogenase [ubiquinone] 1 alpha subcomplex subunit 13 n=1 Tax=Blastocystis sp. subtype 1 (strain ATCC 50177 / NandII) TaxID=478820 RepID=A0A196SNN2_BLAHN|nr:NADH dehydrogenase (ubiquinone) 1 alpha subcomplex 13 [Blastocystis sp. ATCC 50177/Nand II]
MSAPLPKVFVQDLPPKGGYPIINPKRYLPIRVTGATMWLIGTATVGFGIWRMMYGIRKMNEMDQERFNARLAMAPFLQAEEDIRYCAEEDAKLKKEAEVMKDIPGWEVGKSVYNSRKWVPRPQH